MQSLFKYLLRFLFMISAIALSIPSSISLTTPKPDTLSLPLSLINLNSTGLNISNLTFRDPTCSQRLGGDLEIDSCGNAWQKIKRTQHVQRFMPRLSKYHQHEIHPGDVAMPFRYLSDDGLCAIDLRLESGSRGDEATGKTISETAEKILNECVVVKRKGGSARDFSRSGEIIIQIRSYDLMVDCETELDEAPSEKDCEAVLANIPALPDPLAFGATEDWRPVTRRLPRAFSIQPTTEKSCRILVSMPSHLPPTKAKWFDIWAAGVAVNTMCVEHGFTGTAYSLGDNKEITVKLGVVGGGTAQNASAVARSE